MPEMAGEVGLETLRRALMVLGLVAIGGPVAAAWGSRRVSARTVWTTGAALTLAVAVLGVSRLYSRPFIAGQVGLGYTVYFLAMFILLPGVVTTAATVRVSRREPQRHLLVDSAVVLLTLTGSVVTGAVLAALPDLLSLF